jgi:recombination protein RecT
MSNNLPPPRNGQAAPKNGNDLFKDLQAQLNRDVFRSMVKSALPSIVRNDGFVDRFCDSIYSACRDNPDLLTKCDRGSLFQAAVRHAKRGLIVGNGEAYLIPYKGVVQDQIGYRGCLKIVRRSKIVRKISAHAVFERDKFDVVLGTDESVEHRPSLQDRGRPIGVYATAKIDGVDGFEIEFMTWDQVDKIRQRAPSANSPAWRDHPDEMGRKVVLKRLCKRLPTEDEIEDQMGPDDADERTIDGTVTDADDGIPLPQAQLEHQPADEMPTTVQAEERREPEPAQQTSRMPEPQQQRREQPRQEQRDDHGPPDDGAPLFGDAA